jgi:hypothetical protein
VVYGLFDKSKNQAITKVQVKEIITVIFEFLASVSAGRFSQEDLAAMNEKQTYLTDLFRSDETLTIDTFKQRAMNNTVIINCFVFFDVIYAAVSLSLSLSLSIYINSFFVLEGCWENGDRDRGFKEDL